MSSIEAVPRNDAGVVIAGGGHAGGTVATLLRQFGYKAPITIVSEESFFPYQRPPLSKSWLTGGQSIESLELRPANFYAEQQIQVVTRTRVDAINRVRQSVTLSNNLECEYSNLVLATGARARKLGVPGHDLHGVLSLRGLDDAIALQVMLRPSLRIVIIGAGYIGLETAATARKLGIEVIVVERESRVLARVASPEISNFLEARHRAAGVKFLFNASPIDCFQGNQGNVNAVVLADGRILACDVVLVGIGAEPNDSLASAAGLACDQGVVVNTLAQSSDPLIYAIGDVSHRPVPRYSRAFRLESVANVLEQGRQAACAITGRPAPEPEVPWFWSDQYEFKLQIAGLSFNADCTVHRADPLGNRLAVFHLEKGRLVAVEAINAAPEFLIGKKLIACATPVDIDRLRDQNFPIRDLFPIKPKEACA